MTAIRKAGINDSKKDLDRLIGQVAENIKENEQSLLFFSPDQLTLIVAVANATYRAGMPIMSDREYDSLFVGELETQDPGSEFLSSVEPEPVSKAKTIPLPVKMLSTEKAYSFAEVEKWVSRLLKAAKEIEMELSELYIRVTPKLDGYAAYDDGKKLYTRGDGVNGQDITRAFRRGLKVAKGGERGLGAGEIVIRKSYFDEYLSGYFENPRNIQASIIAEKKIDERIQEALDSEACVFYPFELLYHRTEHYEVFLEKFDLIVRDMWDSVDYDIDGLIAEVTSSDLKEYMGSTRHHHRWQIAYKVNEETARVRVTGVVPQTSRTGRLTPVALLEPTKLSGATISRATLHHYGMVKSRGVGQGALVELVRSGLVIPKIESVIESVDPDIPDSCPSCGSHVVWDGDNLFCPNTTDCSAQAENTIIHFFKTLRNIDGFGPKNVSKIYESGCRSIHDFYALNKEMLVDIGFGEKTSENLISQLNASRSLQVDDWRFLAAFGVPRLGEGNCETLLKYYNLIEVFELNVEDLSAITGFAKLSATTIHEGLKSIRNEFNQVFNLGFNIKETKTSKNKTELLLVDEILVFTGTMEHGSRPEMEAEAKSYGAKVGKSVTGKTTMLITGKDVGETKIKAAEQKGVKVITEQDYLKELDSRRAQQKRS